MELAIGVHQALLACLDAAFNFTYVSAAYGELDGRAPGALVGRNYADLYPHGHRQAMLRQVVQSGEPGCTEGRPWGDFQSSGPDGSRWNWSVLPVKDAAGAVTGLVLTVADVTEHTRTIEALSRSEEHFRHLVETANAIPWELELPSWRFTYVGPQATQVLGYPAEAWSDPEFWPAHVHPEDREWALEFCKQTTERGEDHEFEYRMIAVDGRVVWLRDSVQVISGPAGPYKLQGFMFDITARKLAEESSSSRERLLHAVVTNAPIVLWSVDREGIFTLSDGKGLESLGLRPGEVVGRSAFDVYADVPEVLAHVRAALSGKTFHTELTANGRVFDSYYSPLLDAQGDVVGVIGLATDISERKQAEAALRASEAKYRSIFDNAQVGLWRTRLSDGRLMECNDRLAHMFGYRDRAEAKAQYRAPRQYADAETRAQMLARVHAHGEITNFEARMLRKDGSVIWVRYSAKLSPEADYLEGVATDITGEKQALESLRASEQELSKILDSMQDTYYRTDKQGRLIRVSLSGEGLLGYRRNELIGRSLVDLYVDPGAREHFLTLLAEHGGQLRSHETALRHKNGSVVWVSTNAQFYYDEQGNIAGVEGTTRDITGRRDAEVWMRKLSSALEQTADAVMVTDRDGMVEYVNAAFTVVTGYTGEEAIGRSPRLLRSGSHEPAFYRQLWRTILAGEVFQDVFVNKRKDGSLYYEEKTITPLKNDEGQITHFISTGKDISDRMQAQERLQYLAHHDVLTELPNRALFTDRLEHALARSRIAQSQVAVLFLDMDRFKMINDTLGHDVGDHVLRDLARRLRGCVREGDTVARLGGDEFAVIIEDVVDVHPVESVARKILEMLTQPFYWQDRELFITTSIGISLFPEDGNDPKALLKNADIAMYRAKDQGRNTYRFYAAAMGAEALERLSMETSLRHALERDEFVLHYQPQVDMATGRAVGVEALLRWQHPEFGLISPGDFIPILEETGLIVPVGEWVLRAACRQVRAWQESGHPRLTLAVNLSSKQITAPGFAHTVNQVLAQTGMQPELLELEITESMLVEHSADTVGSLRELVAMGLRLAIDDFGTGYSSLSYIKRFSIDTLKIDRAFVVDVTVDEDDAAIVQAIVAMARRLNIQVVAEGVETEAQCDFLRAHDCNLVQGYLFGRPVPAERLPALLEKSLGPTRSASLSGPSQGL